MEKKDPLPALDIPPSTSPSLYPPPFASRVEGRERRRLGDFFGLNNFGINLTRLQPKAISALRHAHAKQDEFMYILGGHPTLYTDDGKFQLSPGMCIGFPAGGGNANHLINETDEDVLFLEIGDRTFGDSAVYPDDDLHVVQVDGKWVFSHKDGSPY